MADLKISQLTGATTPLAGTEVLPIVQSSTTKQVSVTNLTSGRTVDMNIGLVNTTTARTNVLGTITNSFQVEGTGGNTSSGQFIRNAANANGPSLYLGKTRSATVNGNTVVQSGDTLGRMDWLGADGTNLVRAASIYVTVDGTPGSSNMPGKIAFLTSPSGSASPAERVTIDNAGIVSIASNNVVFSTAAKGVNFTANTPAAGMTSQLLNWYEEGTATLTMTGSTAAPTTPVTATARYTRIGRQVTVSVNFDNKDTTGATGNLKLTGLPFAANSSAPGYYGSVIQDGFGTAVITGFTDAGTTDVRFYTSVGLGNVSVAAGAGKYLWLTLTYFV